MVCPSFWEDYYMLIYTHCWELMNSMGSHGSSSLPFMMKVMVCRFVSDSHEVLTALIVMLPLIVVVEISLQLDQSWFNQYLLSCTNFRYVDSGGLAEQQAALLHYQQDNLQHLSKEVDFASDSSFSLDSISWQCPFIVFCPLSHISFQSEVLTPGSSVSIWPYVSLFSKFQSGFYRPRILNDLFFIFFIMDHVFLWLATSGT